jgi:RHS repeat-associated protein
MGRGDTMTRSVRSILTVPLLAVLLLIGFGAEAQWRQYCDDRPADFNPECPKASGHLVGEPTNVLYGSSVYLAEDARITTSVGDLVLRRFFNSDTRNFETHSVAPPGTGAPFGNASSTSGAILWSTNFFSFVKTTVNTTPGWTPTGWKSVAPNGFPRQWRFVSASGYPCTWAEMEDRVYGNGQLERLCVRSLPYQYILYDASGNRYDYGSGARAVIGSLTYSYLDTIYTKDNRILATVHYEYPDYLGGVCPRPSILTSTPGAPYIRRVSSPDGQSFLFTWAYAGGQCVLDKVEVEGYPGAAPRLAVNYTYDGTGELSSVTTAAGTESIVNSSSTFAVSRNNLPVTEQTLSSLAVSGMAGEGAKMTFDYRPYLSNPLTFDLKCHPDSCCAGGSSGDLTRDVFVTTSQRGDGQQVDSKNPDGSPNPNPLYPDPGYTEKLGFVPMNGVYDHTSVLQARRTSCPGSPESCSPGDEYWIYGKYDVPSIATGQICGMLYPTYLKGTVDKRGAYFGEATRSAYTVCTLGGIATHPQIGNLYRGASDTNGTNALETVGAETLCSGSLSGEDAYLLTNRTWHKSLIDPVGDSETHYWQPIPKQVQAIRKTGWTKDIAGNPVEKTIGTFFRNSRSCSDPATDTRVLRVEGPCFLNDPNAGTCPVPHPVTEYHYYPVHTPANGMENRSGRLKKSVRYPNGSVCGLGLETVYDDYTPDGLPASVTTPDGATAEYEYEGRRLVRRRVGGNETRYFYDGERVSAVQYPAGNFEVFCYRTGSSAGCKPDGTPEKLLQWRAKATDQYAENGFTEKIAYKYWDDDTVRSEHFYGSDGTPAGPAIERRQAEYARDAQRRLTWQALGTGTDLVAKRHYDKSDNLDAIGHGFNSPPDFCRDTGANSPLCAWMQYDRANRLVVLDEKPDATTTNRSCFNYDQLGNLVRVSRGGGATADCKINTVSGGLNVPATWDPAQIDYEHDDFGNVIAVKTPWRGESPDSVTRASPSIVRYTYDAFGNVVERQTQMMREQGDPQRTRFYYDLLGRQTSAVTETNSGQSFWVYQLNYDVALAEPGCPTPARVMGRLSNRTDSYGKTWYSYDEEGRVLMEIRQKSGVYGSCTGSLETNPHTTYAYGPNGNLRSIVYPRGREVTYTYAGDRVTGVSATVYDGAAWVNTSLLTGIEWEPYGGLAKYTLVTGGTSANRLVEYLSDGNPVNAPTNTACTALLRDMTGSDLSGRLRSIWVWTGTPGGEILRKTYTWQGEAVKQEDTCFLGQPDVHRQIYAYDRSLRLTGSSNIGVPVEFGSTSGNGYRYDGRGNRIAHSRDGVVNELTYDAATTATRDLLRKQFQRGPDTGGKSGSTVVYDYAYDANGRLVRISSGKLWNMSFTYPGLQDYTAPFDTVMRTVTINGATYTYRYDAWGRRHAKVYPRGETEGFFYDTGHQLLSDQSVALDASGQIAYAEQDDYVWLAGRPVAVVRGKFTGSWVRQSEDASNTCSRMTLEGKPACGAYGIVTDLIGKPILIVQHAGGKVAGTALYDEFGLPNRVRLAASTPVPVGPAYSAQVGRVDWSFSPGATEDVTARVLYANITTKTGDVTVNGSGSLTGWAIGRVWSPFVSAQTGVRVNAKGIDESGISIESVEYRRAEAGVNFWFPPLRFPGHYHDLETDFFENWHRYYDPLTGRYLAPEPLQKSPKFVRGMASGGYTTPTYAYALNRPTSVTDRTGRYAEVCHRKAIGFGFTGARHCFLRINSSMSWSYWAEGPWDWTPSVTEDARPNASELECQPITPPDRSNICSANDPSRFDSCLASAMNTCQSLCYSMSDFNCCDCVARAIQMCGGNPNAPGLWPVQPLAGWGPPRSAPYGDPLPLFAPEPPW